MFAIAFTISFVLGIFATLQARKIALRFGFIDTPGGRHQHRSATPYMGGLAMYLVFLLGILCFVPLTKQIIGILLGGGLLCAVGLIDDKKGLSPYIKLFWQAVSAVILVVFGVGIANITSPFGGIINLSTWNIPFDFFGFHHFTILADLFTLFWIMTMINVMNFLDGVDGLAGGVSFVGCLVLFSLSVMPHVNQPSVALLAIILAGAILGFLNENLPPARIFMGDAGSMFLGFMLASMAIVSSGKIATTALVLGVPILDLIWVALRRVFVLKTHPFKADRSHIHHRLLDLGLKPWAVVLLICGVSGLFGITALFLQSFEKLIALGVLGFVVIGGMTLAEKCLKR